MSQTHIEPFPKPPSCERKNKSQHDKQDHEDPNPHCFSTLVNCLQRTLLLLLKRRCCASWPKAQQQTHTQNCFGKLSGAPCCLILVVDVCKLVLTNGFTCFHIEHSSFSHQSKKSFPRQGFGAYVTNVQACWHLDKFHLLVLDLSLNFPERCLIFPQPCLDTS